MRKTLEKMFVAIQFCYMDFEMHYENMFHLNQYFIIPQSHIKNSVLHYFSILRYFGQREEFFAPFRGFWLVTVSTGYHFEFFKTFLKLSICMLSNWTQVIDLRVLPDLRGFNPLILHLFTSLIKFPDEF